MKNRRFLLVVAWAVLGCSDRHVDDEEEVDVERICSDYCDLRETCSPGAPEYVTSCPGSSSERANCYDECLMSGGPGRRKDLGKDWTDSCRFLRADYYECTNDLTCDEWYSVNACSATPLEEQLCETERSDYSVCVFKD